MRQRRDIEALVVHRIEVSQEDALFGDTPAEVARFFLEHPMGVKATGGVMPYPLLIAASGVVTQTVPLLRVTPHARAHNPRSLGVGLIGDFRQRPPPAPQRQALVELCAELLMALSLVPAAIVGHDELAGGSVDPDKECPGRFLPLEPLRIDVAGAMTGQAITAELVW
jgi:hypothetical protein